MDGITWSSPRGSSCSRSPRRSRTGSPIPPLVPPSTQFSSLFFPAYEGRPQIVRVPSFERSSQTFYAQRTSSQQQQLQLPPPYTPTPSTTPYSPRSQYSLSPLTPLPTPPPNS